MFCISPDYCKGFSGFSGFDPGLPDMTQFGKTKGAAFKRRPFLCMKGDGARSISNEKQEFLYFI